MTRLPWILVFSGLAGCAGFGTDIRAPLYEGGREVARSGPVTDVTFYQVRPGDTLYSVAWKESLDHRALALWNGLSVNQALQPGQRLRLRPPEDPAVFQRIQDASDKGTLADYQSQETPSKPQPASKTEERQQVAATPDNRKKDLLRKAQLVRQQAEQAPPRGNLRWQRPTEGNVVRTYAADDLTRKGVQIAGAEGQPIKAAEAGKVVYSGTGLMGYGQLIIVKHDENYLSAYGNNRKILVKEGQTVAAGEKIGEMGRSDKGSPLLHFEIRYKGKPINPAGVMAL